MHPPSSESSDSSDSVSDEPKCEATDGAAYEDVCGDEVADALPPQWLSVSTFRNFVSYSLGEDMARPSALEKNNSLTGEFKNYYSIVFYQ